MSVSTWANPNDRRSSGAWALSLRGEGLRTESAVPLKSRGFASRPQSAAPRLGVAGREIVQQKKATVVVAERRPQTRPQSAAQAQVHHRRRQSEPLSSQQHQTDPTEPQATVFLLPSPRSRPPATKSAWLEPPSSRPVSARARPPSASSTPRGEARGEALQLAAMQKAQQYLQRMAMQAGTNAAPAPDSPTSSRRTSFSSTEGQVGKLRAQIAPHPC